MFLLVLIILIVLVACCCAKVVPQNHVGMVTMWGKCVNHNHPWGSGIHFKLPFVEHIIAVNLAQGNIKLSDSPIAITTSDQALAYANVALTYHITDPYAYIWGNQDSVEAMRQKVQSMLRDIIGGMKLTDVLNSNEEIQAELSKRIDATTNMYGLKVDQVNIEEVRASQEMQQHMDEQKQSKIDQVSKKNEADGDAAKIKATNDAQNQATVNTAKAQAQATEKAADAKQYAIQKNADARKYSVKAMQDVLKQVGDDPKLAAAYFNYLSIGASKTLANAGNMVFSNGKLNNFGQMAAMQRIWHTGQDDENKKDSQPSTNPSDYMANPPKK